MNISVVTITYNAAKVLKRTLDSVRSQTYRNIEHLIIDGASKDETLEIVRSYELGVRSENRVLREAKRQSRARSEELGVRSEEVKARSYEVRVVSEPDRGIYDAMNKGLKLATGDYIVFMNACDTFHDKTTLEKIASPSGGRLEGASLTIA